MKKLTILLLAAFSLSASAQTKTTTSTANTKQTVKDDGKTLHLTINSSKNGKEIKYDRTFLVAGMSAAQRNALVKKIADSLGVSQPPAPPAPHTMTTASTSHKTNLSKAEIKQTVKDDGKTLHLILNSNKAGKKVNYEHVFAVAGMNKQQKEALVERITDSLHVK
ncbi:MAG: hypothetical protein ACRYFA_14830 [Janthinobacterium lividum]